MKRMLITLGVLMAVAAVGLGIYTVMDSPARYFKGEVVAIEKVDDHKVLVVRENEEIQHLVHIALFTTFTEGAQEDLHYAYFNIREGDYIEGMYHNEFPHKKEFAKEIRVVEQ